jgi:hypothetical protein
VLGFRVSLESLVSGIVSGILTSSCVGRPQAATLGGSRLEGRLGGHTQCLAVG